MGMMERMNFQHGGELSLSDNRAQMLIAEFAYSKEHPEVVSPSNNEIMTAWIDRHSADYRKVVDEDSNAKLKLGDERVLAEWYERILAAHDEGSATMH